MNLATLIRTTGIPTSPDSSELPEPNSHLYTMCSANIRGRITNLRKSKFAYFVDVYIGVGRTKLLQCIAFESPTSPINGPASTIGISDEIEFDGHVFINSRGNALLAFDNVKRTAECMLASELGKKKGGKLNAGSTTMNPMATLLTDVSARARLRLRFYIIRAIRQFFESRAYVEADTSILHRIRGGAIAKPFITHANDLGRDVYLRIATEIELKSLVIAGFDRVFEMGHQFRNESADAIHSPEFMSVEFYQTAATYETMMDLTETLIRELSAGIMDVTFARKSFIDELSAHINVPISALLNSRQVAINECDVFGIETTGNTSHAKAIDLLFDKLVGRTISRGWGDYVFVYDYPILMSPLAKADTNRPDIAQRFELYCDGMEIANGYTEQNDPDAQLAAFNAQSSVDPDAMPVNQPFVRALRYGLPNLAGCGIGVDRLLMILTGCDNIRDVIVRV